MNRNVRIAANMEKHKNLLEDLWQTIHFIQVQHTCKKSQNISENLHDPRTP